MWNSITLRVRSVVCILTKQEHGECADIKNLSVEYIIELCAIEMPRLNVLIVVIYWPNYSRDEIVFEEQLKELLQLITIKYCKKKVKIVGDLNRNFLDMSNQTKCMAELFMSFNFMQNVKEPTRITNTSMTCLDIVFTNFSNEHLAINVRELVTSDHRGVEIAMPMSTTKQSETFRTRKIVFNRKNIQLLKFHLQCIDWSKVVTANKNVNQNYNAFRAFHEQLLKILDYCIP